MPQEPRRRTFSIFLERRWGGVPGKLSQSCCLSLTLQERGGIRYIHVGGWEFSAFKSQRVTVRSMCELAAGSRQTGEEKDDIVLGGGACAPSRLAF